MQRFLEFWSKPFYPQNILTAITTTTAYFSNLIPCFFSSLTLGSIHTEPHILSTSVVPLHMEQLPGTT